MRYIAAIIIFILTLILDLKTDYKLWKEGEPIEHTKGAILRAIGLIPACLLLGWYSFLLIGFTYWTLFDGYFNTMRKFDWWYTGSDDPDDAKLDNLLQRISTNEQKVLKIGGIIVSLGIYLFILFIH